MIRSTCNLVFALALGSAPTLFAQTFTVGVVPTQAVDLAWDARSSKLYGSVQGTPGTGGNSVVPIDPFGLNVGLPVPVGSQPARLAISADGEYLYVGLDGAPSVRRVHLPTQTADLTISMGSDPFFGPYFAEDIAVQPGNSTVIAVSRRRSGVSPRHGGVAIFEGAVQRPNTTPDHTGSNVIEWTDAADTLVGYNNETTDFRVRTMLVNSAGAAIVSALNTGISGFGVDIEYAAGALYATTGVAVNPLTGLTLGTYPSVGSGARVAVNAALSRVYYLSSNVLRTYNLPTFQLLSTQTIPGVQGTPRNLVRWGTSSLAFSTTAGQVFVLTGTESCAGTWAIECNGAPNSTGQAAQIDLLGALSFGANEAVLRCTNLPAASLGLFVMGRQPGTFPLGNGVLCIDLFGGLHRVPDVVAADTNGTASLPLPFATLTNSAGFQPGTTWRFQFWYRDAVGVGHNLSSAAGATFCP